MTDLASADSFEKPSDIEKNPQGVVRRWALELKLAEKREKEWRKSAEKVLNRYRQKDAKKHSFNILWSNTETLRPAVYNSLPKPDVRRRFKDDDPLGKAVSDVLSRALEFGLDTTDFNHDIESTVLDMLLPGRGVARVRYVPTLAQVGVTAETHVEENETHTDGGEALEGDSEEVEWEQAPIEHVQWDDFRHGVGKEWSEVCWVAFRHRLTRDELLEQFGDIGEEVKLDAADDDEIEKERDASVADAFKTAEVWEIWDKDERKVRFVCLNYKESPLKTLDDPLRLQGFWPIPRPLYAVEEATTLIPTPLYDLYKEQAEELDRVSTRINKLVDGLKMRGIYDATLTELSELMRGQDNDLIPAANVTALLERGGLEKAIWFMPIETAAKVLQILYEQRDATKNVIYEITGIADIIRGSSNATETATAQQIKDKWGSMRLRKMQGEVARFIRDLIRLQAEIIGEHFSPETLETMTAVKLPHQAEVEAQMQQALIQAQMAGQPAPQMPQPVTWEQVMQVLQSDKQRTFKIDVETDSTIAASIEADMQGMKETLGAVVELFNGLGPAVQMGALPVEALKELTLAVTRRAKMGNAVEDALDKIKAPAPQADPNAAAAQAEQAKAQVEAQKHQAEMQFKQQEAQANAQLEQMKMQAQAQADEATAQRQAEIERMKADYQAQCDAQRLDFERYKAQLDAETRVLVAQIAAEAGAKQAQISAETTLATKQMEGANQEQSESKDDTTGKALAVAIDGFTAAIGELRKPRTIVRGADGRVSGVQ